MPEVTKHPVTGELPSIGWPPVEDRFDPSNTAQDEHPTKPANIRDAAAWVHDPLR